MKNTHLLLKKHDRSSSSGASLRPFLSPRKFAGARESNPGANISGVSQFAFYPPPPRSVPSCQLCRRNGVPVLRTDLSPVSRNPPYSRYLFQINVPTLRSFFHTFNLWHHLACRRQFSHASRACAHDCREAGNRTPSQCNAWHIRKNKNRGFQLIS